LLGVGGAVFTGFISPDLGNAVATAVVSQAIVLPIELSLSASNQAV